MSQHHRDLKHQNSYNPRQYSRDKLSKQYKVNFSHRSQHHAQTYNRPIYKNQSQHSYRQDTCHHDSSPRQQHHSDYDHKKYHQIQIKSSTVMNQYSDKRSAENHPKLSFHRQSQHYRSKEFEKPQSKLVYKERNPEISKHPYPHRYTNYQQIDEHRQRRSRSRNKEYRPELNENMHKNKSHYYRESNYQNCTHYNQHKTSYNDYLEKVSKDEQQGSIEVVFNPKTQYASKPRVGIKDLKGPYLDRNSNGKHHRVAESQYPYKPEPFHKNYRLFKDQHKIQPIQTVLIEVKSRYSHRPSRQKQIKNISKKEKNSSHSNSISRSKNSKSKSKKKYKKINSSRSSSSSSSKSSSSSSSSNSSSSSSGSSSSSQRNFHKKHKKSNYPDHKDFHIRKDQIQKSQSNLSPHNLPKNDKKIIINQFQSRSIDTDFHKNQEKLKIQDQQNKNRDQKEKKPNQKQQNKKFQNEHKKFDESNQRKFIQNESKTNSEDMKIEEKRTIKQSRNQSLESFSEIEISQKTHQIPLYVKKYINHSQFDNRSSFNYLNKTDQQPFKKPFYFNYQARETFYKPRAYPYQQNKNPNLNLNSIRSQVVQNTLQTNPPVFQSYQRANCQVNPDFEKSLEAESFKKSFVNNYQNNINGENAFCQSKQTQNFTVQPYQQKFNQPYNLNKTFEKSYSFNPPMRNNYYHQHDNQLQQTLSFQQQVFNQNQSQITMPPYFRRAISQIIPERINPTFQNGFQNIGIRQVDKEQTQMIYQSFKRSSDLQKINSLIPCSKVLELIQKARKNLSVPALSPKLLILQVFMQMGNLKKDTMNPSLKNILQSDFDKSYQSQKYKVFENLHLLNLEYENKENKREQSLNGETEIKSEIKIQSTMQIQENQKQRTEFKRPKQFFWKKPEMSESLRILKSNLQLMRKASSSLSEISRKIKIKLNDPFVELLNVKQVSFQQSK